MKTKKTLKALNLIIYIFLTVFLSCKTTTETRVTHIKDSNLITKSGIIYALPKTSIKFNIEATKTNIIPGPYYEYAEKYMGIENVPEEEISLWQITNIRIETYNEIDPDHYYILEPSGKMQIDFNKLITNGSILPVNNNTKINTDEFYGRNSQGNEIAFTDLSVTKYVGEEKITYYKRVQRDSIQAKIPVVKKQSVYKSFENKVEEAANFIFMIREKRFELLTGMADFYPEGKSLEVAINELNRLENDYLELFIGKRYTSSYKTSFEFTPTETELTQPYILFRFNEEKGILSPNDLSGSPIIVELQEMGLTKNLSYLISDKINRKGTEYNDKLYYRIPDAVEVKVFDGKIMLTRGKVDVAQYGAVVLFPNMFLLDDEKFIEFYREEETKNK